MAFKRVVELDVGPGGIGLRVSGLDMDFSIKRTIELSKNSAEFTIYNAKESTRNQILKIGNNVVFKAGHEDEKNIATCFLGTISASLTVKNGPDWVTTVTALDIGNNKKPLKTQTISISYVENTPFVQVLNDFSTLISTPLFGVENVTNTLSNGIVFAGTVGGFEKVIRDMLSASDNALYFDNGEMVIYKKGVQNSKFGVVQISQRSGLIGSVEDISDDSKQDSKKRIGFTSLLNPKYRPGGLVNVQSETVKGVYSVEVVGHNGNNYGGDFFTTIEAIE